MVHGPFGCNQTVLKGARTARTGYDTRASPLLEDAQHAQGSAWVTRCHRLTCTAWSAAGDRGNTTDHACISAPLRKMQIGAWNCQLKSLKEIMRLSSCLYKVILMQRSALLQFPALLQIPAHHLDSRGLHGCMQDDLRSGSINPEPFTACIRCRCTPSLEGSGPIDWHALGHHGNNLITLPSDEQQVVCAPCASC